MSLIRQVTFNTASQLISRGVIIITTLLFTIILRRYSGQSSYGVYIYITNLVTLMAALVDFGTHLTTVKEASVSAHKALILGNSFILRFAFAGLSFIFAGIVLIFFPLPPEVKALGFLPYALILLLVLQEGIVMVFQAYEKLYLASLLSVLIAILNVFALLAVWQLRLGLRFVFTGLVFSLTVSLLPTLLWFIKKNWLQLSPRIAILKKLLYTSLPLGAILVLFTVYSRIDTILINYFYDSSAVGAYGLAYKVYDNLVLPAAFLLNALLPEISRRAADSPHLLLTLSKKVMSMLLLMSVCAVTGTLIFSGIVMRLITGESAAEEASALSILSLATIFSYPNHLTGYLIIALGKQKWSLLVAIIALLVNGAANIVLLPVLGINAAALSTILTEAIVFFLSAYVVVATIQNHKTVK